VLNRAWKRVSPNNYIRIYLLDIIHSSTKNAFWDVNNKKCIKWCNFVSSYLFNNTYGLHLLKIDHKCPNQVFYVWLADQQTIWAKYGLETWSSPNDDSPNCLLDMMHNSNINAFCVVNNKKWRKWCKYISRSLFVNTYGLPVLAIDTTRPNQIFYVWLDELQSICAK
jgi:hypothetical protein